MISHVKEDRRGETVEICMWSSVNPIDEIQKLKSY